MRHLRLALVMLAVVLVVGAFVAGGVAMLGLRTELNQIKADLAETTVTLQHTSEDLSDHRKALSAQRVENAQLEGENSRLEGERQDLETTAGSLTEQLGEVTAERDNLDTENEGLRGDLGEVNKRYADLSGLYVELGEKTSALRREHTALTHQYEELDSDFAELERLSGTADSLGQKIEGLQAEIEMLEEQREPLILGRGSTSRNGFACTGSMEPVLTCLDEATWLDDFRPEDVTVGATISFNPNCGEDEPDRRGTAHRVMDIKVENGVHYYWPKGDNNREPDGCWVPETDVDGYIVEIHKDVRPENAKLRNNVNAASTAYDEAYDAYYALHDQYCVRGVSCTVPSDIYAFLTSLGATLDQAWERYDCWRENALNVSSWPPRPPRQCP